MVIEVMDEQPAKQLDGIVINSSGRWIDVNDLHAMNAPYLMDVIEFGREIEVIANPQNACLPTDVIVFGIVTICRSRNSPSGTNE